MKFVDVQKRFLDIPDVSQIFGGPPVCRCDMNEGLNNPLKGGCLGNLSWLTGNVWISTANRLSIHKILGIIHGIYFILQFLKSSR